MKNSNENSNLMEHYNDSRNGVLFYQNNVLIWQNRAAEEKITPNIYESMETVDKQVERVDVIKVEDKILNYYCQPVINGCFIEMISSESLGINNNLRYYASTIVDQVTKNINTETLMRLKNLYFALEFNELYDNLPDLDVAYGRIYANSRVSITNKNYIVLVNKPLTPQIVNLTRELRRYCVEFAPCFFSNRIKDKLAIKSYEDEQTGVDNLFEFNLPKDNYLTKIDIPKLRFCISHLLSNALYFTSPGNKIKLNAQIENNVLKISVLDRGVGFMPCEIEAAKQPLYSYDPNSQRRAGVGLGLSYVDLFAKKSGGDCVITSSRDQTMVTIAIPVVEEKNVSGRLNQKNEPYHTLSAKDDLLALSNVLKVNVSMY